MNRSRTRTIRLGILVPGLQGGVDEAAQYIFASNSFEHIQPKIYITKGPSSWLAPFRFALTFAQITFDRLQGNLDIIHMNVSWRGSTARKILVASFLQILQVPYVVQLHSGGYQHFWDSTPAVGKILIRQLFHHASQTLILGQAFRYFVTNEIGVDPERVIVVPNGVPVPSLRHQQDNSKPTVFFLGRLNHNKGYRDLLAALDQCSDLEWSAVLMGDGETDEALKIVQRYGLSNRVTIKGWTNRTLADKAMQNSSILVLPSHSEALSLTLLEAMASGLACIATPVGAQLDVLSDESNSLIVQPGEIEQLSKALHRLINDPELRRELGAEARADIKRWFSIEAVCSQLEEIYCKAVSESNPHKSEMPL